MFKMTEKKYCSAMNQEGNNCCNTAKIEYKGKQYCKLHYNMLKNFEKWQAQQNDQRE